MRPRDVRKGSLSIDRSIHPGSRVPPRYRVHGDAPALLDVLCCCSIDSGVLPPPHRQCAGRSVVRSSIIKRKPPEHAARDWQRCHQPLGEKSRGGSMQYPNDAQLSSPKTAQFTHQPPALVSLLSCPVGSLTSVYIIVIASSTPFSLHSPPQGRSGSMTFSRMADHRGPSPQTQSPGPAKPRLACSGRPPMLPHFYVFSLSFSTTPIGHACHRLDGSTSQCFFCHAEKAII